MAYDDPVGAKISIGPANSVAANASAFAALSYTQIKGVDQIPAIGPSANVVKFTPLETGVVEKRKGSVDNGDPEVVLFLNNKDAGQLALVAAQATKNSYAFKVVLNDAASASATNTTFYFLAVVSSTNIEKGAADNITRRHATLNITGSVVEVPTV